MKIKTFYIAITIFLVLLLTISILFNKTTEVLVMNEVNLDIIDNEIIGSEPPKIIYADYENIIIYCRGVYVYNIIRKSVTKTFDIMSFIDENHPNTYCGCFVVQDGKKIIFSFSRHGGPSTYYCYSFNSDTLSILEEAEYTKYRENVSVNSIYEKVNNIYTNITYISDTEYVYLLSPDMIIGNIVVVYVKDSEETHYQIFQ